MASLLMQAFSALVVRETLAKWVHEMRLRAITKSTLILISGVLLFILLLNLIPDRREVRQPIPHVYAVSDAQFLRTMSSLFEGNVTNGHGIDTLLNGDEIFPAMLEAIEGAESTVNFLTYIY